MPNATGFSRTQIALHWAVALLIALHVGAALSHQFVVKDGLIRRMMGTSE